jgi:hypothetical protein
MLDRNAGNCIGPLAQRGSDDAGFAVLMSQRLSHRANAVGIYEALKLDVQVRRIGGELEVVGLDG